ncbi:MAG: cytidine deaminase [Pseudomonadota bacterium]
MPDDTDNDLVSAAIAVRENAYCPYSHFSVGAALLDETGTVHVGCNVENSSYPEGNCAETGAIASMVASGARKICRIVVAGGFDEIETCTPCGGCRQRIAEFSDDDTVIVIVNGDGGTDEYRVADLLPLSFRLEQ